MSTTMMVVLGAAMFALVAVPMLRPNARKRAMARARHTGDLSGLVALVEQRPLVTQADAWDQLLLELWQRYERELAANLIVEAAPRSDAKIIQYWIGQVLTIEPEIAQEVFTPDFLADHFKPEVANACGRSCGCG